MRLVQLAPSATWAERLAARWLAWRPAGRMALHATSRGSLRYSALGVAVIGCFAAVAAIAGGVPLGIAVPVALLAPLLADHLPDRLDTRARRRIRVMQGEAATEYLQRFAVLHTGLLQAAAGTDRHEVHRSAEVVACVAWLADLCHSMPDASLRDVGLRGMIRLRSYRERPFLHAWAVADSIGREWIIDRLKREGISWTPPASE